MARERQFIQDPQPVQEIIGKNFAGEPLSKAELEIIAHTLTEKPKRLAVDYDQYAQAKFDGYEKVMDNLGSIRDSVAVIVNNLNPSSVLDLGAGFGMIKKRLKDVEYTAVDNSKKTRDIALDEVDPNINYIVFDLTNGLPDDLPDVHGENAVAIAIWSLSYLRADEILKIMDQLKELGYTKLLNVGLDPDEFKVPEILDEMITRGEERIGEEPKLAPIIESIREGQPVRNSMIRFGNSLKELPIRSESVTKTYLEQGGDVIDSGRFDKTTGFSFWHLVDLT